MKIVFLDEYSICGRDISAIKSFGNYIGYETTSPDQVLERCADAEVVISNKVVLDADTIAALPKLRLICVAATGMNNIDLNAAAEHGVEVRNAVGYSTYSVAETTLCSALSLLREGTYYASFFKSGKYAVAERIFNFDRPTAQLRGKRWGIIGLGNIGRNVAKVAEAFGAEVVYYSTTGKNNNPDFKRVEFDELMSSCDIISIHAPINDQTRNLVDARALSLMKQSAIIINLGRGGIINEAALAEALDNEAIAGAGVDVFTQEPIVAENPLLSVKHPERLVLAPHIGWTSVEARNKIVVMIADNIKNFLN